MKKYFMFLLFFQTIFSQHLITNVGNRNTVSLNGNWNYIVDPYETGFYNYRLEPFEVVDKTSKSAFYNDYHPKDKTDWVEYNFDSSSKLKVPGDWNSQEEKLFYYEGNIWMKKSFDYNLQDKRRLFVYFGAVNYKVDVYLNGVKLGFHEGGFTPFNFEITNTVKAKDNYLIVKIDNRRFKEAVPTINTDWWNYGGITRDVMLIDVPLVFVEDYSLQLKKYSKNVLSGFVKMNNASVNDNVTIEIPELKISKNFKCKDDNNLIFEIPIPKTTFWSPENPKLYKVRIKTNHEIIEDEIGFRTIEAIGSKIVLNGTSIFLKGISIHEENTLKGSRANSNEDALLLLNWAKELGCNYVRLAHYPHNENIIKLADKLGMMVWEEIPVYWTIDFSNEKTLLNAKNQLTEVITRDKNRAAVIIWSMANETPPSQIRNSFIINLVNHAKTLDDTRLISAALETHNENGVSVVNDSLGNYMDIIAFNEYRGWYGGTLDDAPEVKWRIDFNKPVIISEFGGEAKAGLHGDKTERWTEEYQEYLYQQNIKMIEKIPNYSGMSPWILADFRSPKRLLPNIQDGHNRKGLISSDGIKKKAFYVLKQYYNTK